MTDDPKLQMARRVAAKALRDRKMPSPSYEAIDVEAGKYDEHSAVQAALAAIEETTGQIARWIDRQELPGVGIESVDEHIAVIAGDLAEAIVRGDHLKGPTA